MRYKGFKEYLIINKISLKEYEERLNEQLALVEKEMIRLEKVSAKGTLKEFYDDVKSPKHYKLEGLELEGKDIIKSVLGKEGYKSWCHGTALKYLFRAGKKEDELKDFKKAKEYLDWIIDEMED